MNNSLRTLTFSSVILVLTACATSTSVHDSKFIPPGKLFEGLVINITAPKSEGWKLLKSEPSVWIFGRRGSTPGESFAAMVAMFDPPQTDSPENFEALIVQGAQADSNTERFRTKTFTHQFTSARGYPCVQMSNISEDTQAQSGPNKTETLIMQNEHLYCRHPERKNIGFAITYSHRGKEMYPDFQAEAHSFIEGIQVPSAPTSK
jgi:hypothetical protein